MKQAEYYFKKSIETKSGFCEYYLSLGNLYFENLGYHKAAKQHKIALKKIPNDLKFYFMNAFVNRNFGNKQEGIK